MKRIARMSAEELAAHVCQTLGDAGITVTLTGGACVAKSSTSSSRVARLPWTMDMADLQRWAKQEGRHDAFAEFLSLIEAHNNGEK